MLVYLLSCELYLLNWKYRWAQRHYSETANLRLTLYQVYHSQTNSHLWIANSPLSSMSSPIAITLMLIHYEIVHQGMIRLIRPGGTEKI